MAQAKLLNLLAVLTLAVIACSFGATPANALATHGGARRHSVHDALVKKEVTVVKKKRSNGRCKPRPSSLTSSKTAAPTSAPAPPTQTTSSKAAPPPPPKSSAAAPPPPPSQPITSNGGKTGLAWGGGGSLKTWKGKKVNAYYNWSPYKDGGDNAGLKFFPMMWSWRDADAWTKLVKRGYGGEWALAVNEPNEPHQSALSPGSAASLWRQYMNPLVNEGYKLCSPATSSNPNGMDWMKEFFKECPDCHVDAMCVHWYDVKSADMITYIQNWHNTFNKPIIVTEYACQNFNGGAQCSPDEIWNFQKTVTQWMDSTDYVLYYFTFGTLPGMDNVNPNDQMMGGDGSPNSLGWNYIDGFN